MVTDSAIACPKCGHGNDEHRRESWYDEEGVEGMTCATCETVGRLCSWWTWEWAEVVAQTATHQGDVTATDSEPTATVEVIPTDGQVMTPWGPLTIPPEAQTGDVVRWTIRGGEVTVEINSLAPPR